MKLNATIDGNYLLNKDVFILAKEKTLYSDLPVYMRMEIEKILKFYPFDNVFFLSDSKKRWRSRIFKEYKSTRVQKENIDWDEVYKIYDEFKEELKQNKRIKMYEVDYAEGDDLIAYIVRAGNQLGYSNLIIASDGDLHQLLNFDINKGYINFMYNMKFSDERTYLPKNYNVFLNSVNNVCDLTEFYELSEDLDIVNYVNQFIRKTKITEVIDEESLFVKLLSGDKKDAIPSVYIKNNRGIGKEGALKLYEKYKNIYDGDIDFDSDLFLEHAASVVALDKKVHDEEILTNVKNNLILNRKLIILKENYLPSDLLKTFKETINVK